MKAADIPKPEKLEPDYLKDALLFVANIKSVKPSESDLKLRLKEKLSEKRLPSRIRRRRVRLQISHERLERQPWIG